MGQILVALKKAIIESSMTRKALAQKSGVEEASISRFLSGKTGLNLESIERLSKVLGLKLKK